MHVEYNPVAEARYDSGRSLTSLARELMVSKQYISQVEKGLYTNVNEKLVDWAADELAINPAAVVRRYFAFQDSMRKRTKEEVGPLPLGRRGAREPGSVIFRLWREQYWHSPLAFAGAMCVHPEMVVHYEEGLRSSLPQPIKKALMSVQLIDPNWSEAPWSDSRYAPLTGVTAP